MLWPRSWLTSSRGQGPLPDGGGPAQQADQPGSLCSRVIRGTLGVVEGGTVGRGARGMLLLVVLALLAGLAVVLSACGEPESDEFVGTWRRFDYKTEGSPPLVIVKTDGGYRGTLVYSNAQPQWELHRVGDTLTGEARSSRGPVAIEFIYQGQAGHITFRGAAMPGDPVSEVEFVRVSTRTTIETPSPL